MPWIGISSLEREEKQLKQKIHKTILNKSLNSYLLVKLFNVKEKNESRAYRAHATAVFYIMSNLEIIT